MLLSTCFTLAGDRIPLWPEGKIPDFQEHQIAALKTDAKKPGLKAEEHRMPYIEWHKTPEKKK